jgi:polyisoprenoid-binding protein YceI
MQRNNSGMRLLHSLGLALSCLATALALAADAGIDVTKSTIVATFRQESVPVEAPFRKFSGQVVYDASQPAVASANLDVETGSLDIGDPAYNAEIRKPAWFDSGKFPQATFRSTAVKAISAARFEATGALTIKGRVLTITVPVAVSAGATGTAFDGTLLVSRQAFGIGDPSWKDVIEDQVSVRFHLVNASH